MNSLPKRDTKTSINMHAGFGIPAVGDSSATYERKQSIDMETSVNANVDVEDAQVEDAQVEDAQVEDAQVEDAQVEDAQVEDAQVEDAQVEDTQVEESSISASEDGDVANEDCASDDSVQNAVIRIPHVNRNESTMNVHTDIIAEAYAVSDDEESQETTINVLPGEVVLYIPEVEAESVHLIQESWRMRPIFKRFPFLSYQRFFYIIAVFIIIAAVAAITNNRARRTNVLGNQDPTSSPTPSPTMNPTFNQVVWEKFSDFIRMGDETIISDETTFPSQNFFSLSQDGRTVALAGLNQPRIYEFSQVRGTSSGSWVPKHSFPEFDSGNYKSIYLSPDGLHLMIGDPFQNDSTGSVTVFSKADVSKDGQWEQVGETIFGERMGDAYGIQASITDDGRRVAIVVRKTEVESFIELLDFDGNDWRSTHRFLDTLMSMGMNGLGDRLVTVGSSSLKIFELETFTVIQEVRSTRFNSRSPVSLSRNGKAIVIGNPDRSFAQLFHFDEEIGEYIQLADPLLGPNQSFFGGSVSLSADGRRVAISAQFFATRGNNIGQITIYQIDNGVVTEIAKVSAFPDGNFVKTPVILSADGNVVGIASYGFDIQYENSMIGFFEALKF